MEEVGTQFNKILIRMLYSPESQVISIHYLNLNPYNAPIIVKNPESTLVQSLNNPASSNEGYISNQVFLKRNLKLMEKIRAKEIKQNALKSAHRENGLIIRS